ncbi:kinase-like domain-containing protein [Roridomyces roridus]|uniref:Kinase-like domain-containing protein n=1 Tax=Roridomyces roridus TaxID=1738132 RepID=A0AAD7CKH3_9AGAR|nr:kinase-like domain-containing protein [Roridomyces roridus]
MEYEVPTDPATELIETEELHVHQLRGIVKEVAGAWSRTNTPPKKLDAVFRSIKDIYRAHRSLLKRLKNTSSIYGSSPGALAEILVRCQVEDLEGPYSKYCSTFCTGFDACEPVKSNPRLPGILSAFTVSNPPPAWALPRDSGMHTSWTLDTLFLLPRVRLRYYRRLYLQRFFTHRTPAESGNDCYFLVFEKIYKCISVLETREKLQVADVEDGTAVDSTGSLLFPPGVSSSTTPLKRFQDFEPNTSSRIGAPGCRDMELPLPQYPQFETEFILGECEMADPRDEERQHDCESSGADLGLLRSKRTGGDVEVAVAARQALPFSQYRSDSQSSIWEDSTVVDSHCDSGEGVMRGMIERLSKRFHGDEEWYARYLACRGTAAQWLLDLLQDLLDYDANCAPADRHRLFKALLRLSADSELYPRCFTLAELEHERLVAGGSFSDVYMGYLCGQCVAVKMMRVFDESDIEAVLKVRDHITPVTYSLICMRHVGFWSRSDHMATTLPSESSPILRPLQVPPEALSCVALDGERAYPGLLEEASVRNGQTALSGKSPDTCHCDNLTGALQTLDVALGLEHLHGMGVIHGDLKADNIFVTSSGRACIADFGLASITSSMSSIQFTHSSKASRGGTARYQAPELHRGGHNDRRSDIYGFACVVYEFLTGTAPFPELPSEIAVMFAVLEGRRPSRPPSCSGTPTLDGLWALLQDCWHADPDSRPTAVQVVQRLRGGDIGAVENSTQSVKDWDSTSTSKFRRRLFDHGALPTLVEFENVVSGTVRPSLAQKVPARSEPTFHQPVVVRSSRGPSTVGRHGLDFRFSTLKI